MELTDILKILPHKHPYLLVDKVIALEKGKRVVAVKAVTYSEPFFRGHYPDNPILPGAVMIEASSQVAGLLANLHEGTLGYVVEVKRFKFKKQVRPGNLLEIEAVKSMAKGPFLLAKIKVMVSSDVVAEGELQLYIEKKK